MPVVGTKAAASSQGFGEFALVAAGSSSQANAIDFDGTNDYLSRASDMTGNTTSATFTFSAWVWRDSATQGMIYCTNGSGSSTSERFTASISSGGALQVVGYNSSGSQRLNFSTAAGSVPVGTWTSILVSINLDDTANRWVYINDVAVSPTWNNYTSDPTAINFSGGSHYIARYVTSSIFFDGRLSNVFLDYTYRDMSVTANRRLFITADLKPAAGQAALNPILYLPMSDPTAPGTNSGTGGNFTLTGTVARSGRGPNQYNAPYSTFDGSADYLSRTSAPTGIANSKTFTISFTFKRNGGSGNERLVELSTGGGGRFEIKYNGTSTIEIFAGGTAGGNTVLAANFDAPTMVVGRNYVLTISIDLASTSNRYVFFNGEAASVTWSTYVNSNIEFAPVSPQWSVGASIPAGPGRFYNGQLGALWFNTSYIDLSVAANLAKFVSGTGINAVPVDLGATGELPTGTSPLIYLPMYGNNAGKNYGTGGNFTVNSGPYTGARGPNEFWGNWVYQGETGTITRSSALSGVSDVGTGSFVFSFWPNQVSTNKYILTVGGTQLQIRFNSSNGLRITATNSGGTTVLSADNSLTITTGSRYTVFFSFDLSNTSKRYFSVNGNTTTTWDQYTPGATIPYSTRTNWRFFTDGSTGNYDGRLGEFFFTTEYIDFPLEANRLKFYDAFNNPCNLPSAITAATIPTPAIYLRFDPASLGSNSGTGGSFSPSGTFYDLGQF